MEKIYSKFSKKHIFFFKKPENAIFDCKDKKESEYSVPSSFNLFYLLLHFGVEGLTEVVVELDGSCHVFGLENLLPHHHIERWKQSD